MRTNDYARGEGGRWKLVERDERLTASADACHGRCFGFEEERATWAAPRLALGSAAADAAKGKGIEVITVAVNTGSSLDIPFLFSLNSTGLGFQVTSFDEAEDVTLKILGEIDISCPPLS